MKSITFILDDSVVREVSRLAAKHGLTEERVVSNIIRGLMLFAQGKGPGGK